MTVFIPFRPSVTAPFKFALTLDGTAYNAVVTWNAYAQRWYLNIYTVGGAPVVTRGLVSSPIPRLLAAPAASPVVLTALLWQGGLVTATAAESLGFTIGSVHSFTVAGCSPDAYNGVVSAVVASDTKFTYGLSADPGPVTVLGTFEDTDPPVAVKWTPAGTDFATFSTPSGNESPFRGTVAATTADPLLFKLGSTVRLTIAGVQPDGYNGRFPCLVTGVNSFVYSLPDDPGPPPSVRGTYSPDVSLTDGYFNSTLIYREQRGVFEVSP